MARLLLAAAAAVAVASATTEPGASPLSCRISQNGATYDFTNLGNPTADWTWNDPWSMDTQNLTYVFNICQNVVNPPYPICRAGNPAYQTTNNSAQGITCNVAGTLTNTLTTLYDPTDPSKGALLTYNGGDIQPGSNNCRISFGIAFQCADFPFPSPVGPYSRSTHFVEQTNICQYTAFAFSQAGCPQECPIVNGAVCSAKGICGYDKNSASARCFCDDGYREVDCNTPVSPFPTGAVAGSAIGGIIVGAASLFGFAFYRAKFGGVSGPSVDGFYGGQL